MDLKRVLDIPGWGSEAKLLYMIELVQKLQPSAILDLGCYRGRSTAALALAAPETLIIACDAYGEDADRAFFPQELPNPISDMVKTIQTFVPNKISLVPIPIENYQPGCRWEFDFAHVDSAFTKEERFGHLKLIRWNLGEGATVLIDDARMVGSELPIGYQFVENIHDMIVTKFDREAYMNSSEF